MKNLAIIPARSGSKGLKDKNIKELNGKPLLAYSILAAKASNLFDEIIVSTDSVLYAEIAKQWGASVPFLRSNELSSDTASSWDVVREIIVRLNESGKNYDTVALLQPTSPLRTVENIVQGYQLFERKNAKSVIGVCEVDHSPLWSNTLSEDLSLERFIRPEVNGLQRQEIPTYYRINGALYIVDTAFILQTKDIFSERSFAYIMEKHQSIDIDDEFDFVIANALMKG